MLDLSLKNRVLLTVIIYLGRILSAVGQACSSEDAVTMCTDTSHQASSVNLDFYMAEDYIFCSCRVDVAQNDTLFFKPTALPGADCGMEISIRVLQSSIIYKCRTSTSTSEHLSASSSLSIEIMRIVGLPSPSSDFCFQINSDNNLNFTLSCEESAPSTMSASASTTKSSSPSVRTSTTAIEVSSSDTSKSPMTSYASTTNNTAPKTVPISGSSSALTTGSSTLSPGTVTTPKDVNNQEKSELDTAIVAGAAGGGGACLVIICIVVIVCYRRMRTNKQVDEHGAGGQKHEHNHIYDNDSSIPVDDNYDLTDNVLYNSVCIPDQEMPEIPQNRNNNKNTGYEDAEVVRTNRQNNSHVYSTPASIQPEGTDKDDNSAREDKEITPDSKNDESSIPIYAVANKKKKINEKENCEIPVYAMPMKKKNTNSREIPSTKPKPAVAKKPTKPSERRVNDDGLCYADLEISNSAREETRSSVNNSNESDVQYADVRI